MSKSNLWNSHHKKKIVFHFFNYVSISSVQFSHSVVSDSFQPHELQHARPPCPSPTPGVHWDSSPSSQWCHQPSHPLSSPSPPAPNPSQHQSLFQWVMRWPKYWSFSFSISPSKQHLGLISFRIDWLDLLAVQGTLKSLLQHHSSKASSLRHSAFFTVQLSHPYMTTGKTIALTSRTFVGKVMSLLFNVLSQIRSVAQPCPTLVTPWIAACQASLSITNSWSLPKLRSFELVMPSSHLILCHPLLLLPSVFFSIRVFSTESILHIRWPKYWFFSFSINPANEYSAWFPLGLTGLISLQSKGLSRVFSNTTVQKHWFFGAQLSL